MQPCEGARIIARVGSEVILEGDVIGGVNQWIENNKARIPTSQLEATRAQVFKEVLQNRIIVKLFWQDAKGKVPEEAWKKIEKQLEKGFDDTRIEEMMKDAGVTSRADLDAKLRALGTSLDREKRSFMEQSLAQGWKHDQINPNKETTYDELLRYYQEHRDEFTAPARARYEELMVRFDKYPNKNAAWDAIARMGNQVLAGAPFGEVAKAGSDGATAADGGQRPWTTQGSLTCEKIDQALFNLPIGRLSPILENPLGLYIIRVIQREDVTVTDFQKAQADIKDRIVKQRGDKQFKEYVAKLAAKTPIWTIFDSDIRNPQLSRRVTQQR